MKNKIIPYHPKLKSLARILRKQGVLSEVLLWKEIQKKSFGVEFHRQVPLLDYIVDFYCHELMLAIEIDGITHEYDDVAKNDAFRQVRLEEQGVLFVRINDRDVKKDIGNVMYAIEDAILLRKKSFDVL